MTECNDCGKKRTDEIDYSPMQAVTSAPFGWYSGKDGELCPSCFTALMAWANR